MTNKERVIRTCQTCGDQDEYMVNYCGLSHEMPEYRHSLEKYVCHECRSKIANFVWCEHSRACQQKQAEKHGKKGKKDAKREAV
jgi:hypothetical protein